MWLLDEYHSVAGLTSADVTVDVDIVNDVDVLPSRLATSELALDAVTAATGAALRLLHARTGREGKATVDGRRVSAAFRSDRHLRVNGAAIEGFAPLSGFWRSSDGWIRTHANYPHHRERLLATLGIPDPNPEALAAAMRERSGHEVEDALAAGGGVGVVVRTAEQWRDHPQAQAVARLPLVGLRRLDGPAPLRLPVMPDGTVRPAAGLRVLDLTRVIAGPVASRTLALLDADVLRVDSPRLPEIPWQHLDAGMGKRSTLLDLATQGEVFDRLLRGAHVVLLGYRPGAMDRYGLTPEELIARRPGLVVGTLSAWGGVGPWGARRGFDSIVQAASGIAVIEGADSERPGALPAQALDHATGYLLAAAVLDAVTGRLTDGGGRHVQVHLARTATALLAHPDSRERQLPGITRILRDRSTPSGSLRYPPPAVQLHGGPDDWEVVGGPWGVDPPAWAGASEPRAG